MQTVNLVRGGTKLAPKQQEAIQALLQPGSIEDAAREIGVTTKKLAGWMKNPVFMAAHRAAIRAEQPRCGNVPRYRSAKLGCLVLSVVYDRDSVRIWLAPTNTVAEPLRREKRK
jgi:hypothetical protein